MAHLDHTPEVPEQPDEWHMHTAAEGPPQEEHGSTVNTALLFLAFVGSVVTVAAVALLTYIYFSTYTNQLWQSRVETTVLAEDYLRYRQQTRQTQQDFVWVRVEDEVVLSLPLDVATDRVLSRYQGESQGGGPR